MRRGSRLPEDVALVVRPDRRSAVRAQLSSMLIFAGTVVIAGFGVAATGTVFGLWGAVGLLCVVGVLLEVMILRSEVACGPAFAADADHVWLRLGGFLRPVSVRLDWPEITGIGLRRWQGRRGATARYLTVRLTEQSTAAFDGELAAVLDRRLRRLADTFGARLAISEQHKVPSLDEVVRRLRELAPDGVRFTAD